MSSGSPIVATSRYRVGLAMPSAKIETFIQPSMEAYAADNGIDFIAIDPQTPLASQGPFHCLLHKLKSPDWTSKLLHFISQNSSTPVVDHPSSIEPLNNRTSMLEAVNRISLADSSRSLTLAVPKQASGRLSESENDSSRSLTLGVPKQVVVSDSGQLSESESLLKSLGLEFPLIAKAESSHGSSDSHEMSLVFSAEGLKALKPPVVLQEFVKHGGVIFKVYVAGRHVRIVKRRSLPDVSEDELRGSKGILTFSQISNLSSTDPDCHDVIGELVDKAELPPMEFVMEVAKGLRKAMGLRLFNFDMIRDSRDASRYFIIDINYFPGFAKVPGFEKMFTEFLLDVVNGKEDEDGENGEILNNC